MGSQLAVSSSLSFSASELSHCFSALLLVLLLTLEKSDLNIDDFLKGCRHVMNPRDSAFFDFPSNTQFLVCCVNDSIVFWKFEHKPSKSFSIPSLQISPFPSITDTPIETQVSNHIFLVGFGTGLHECRSFLEFQK